MPKYTVVQPVGYISNGVAVHQTDREVGNVIELDDAQAAPLVKAGALQPHAIEGAVKTTGVTVEVLSGPSVETKRGRAKADDESA